MLIRILVYLVCCDAIHYGIRNLFTMSSVIVICSLDDMQLVVWYKFCKLMHLPQV
jgi:hypothetical protein